MRSAQSWRRVSILGLELVPAPNPQLCHPPKDERPTCDQTEPDERVPAPRRREASIRRSSSGALRSGRSKASRNMRTGAPSRSEGMVIRHFRSRSAVLPLVGEFSLPRLPKRQRPVQTLRCQAFSRGRSCEIASAARARGSSSSGARRRARVRVRVRGDSRVAARSRRTRARAVVVVHDLHRADDVLAVCHGVGVHLGQARVGGMLAGMSHAASAGGRRHHSSSSTGSKRRLVLFGPMR